MSSAYNEKTQFTLIFMYYCTDLEDDSGYIQIILNVFIEHQLWDLLQVKHIVTSCRILKVSDYIRVKLETCGVHP